MKYVFKKVEIYLPMVMVLLSVMSLKGYATLNEDLLLAVQAADVKAAERALRNGADENAENEHGETALQLAVNMNHPEIVKLLLEYDANAWETFPNTDVTPLMVTAYRGYAEVAEILLEHGIEPNAQRARDGTTALMFALQNFHAEVAESLLQHGADVNMTNEAGGTALLAAASWGKPTIVQLLLDYGANPHIRTKNGWTTLMSAAKGHVETTQLLLEYGVDVNAIVTGGREKGKTALIIAIQWGQPDVVKLLLEHGADVNIKTETGKTALDIAMSKQDIHEVDKVKIMYFLKQGKTTPNEDLLYAAHIGDLQLVQKALQQGANPNTRRSHDGWTALIVAAWWGQPEVIELLLQHGADIQAKTNDGKTALDLIETKMHAQSARHIEVLYRLKQGKTSPNEDLLYAAKIGDVQFAQQALKKGAHADTTMKNCYPKDCKTALVFAVRGGHFDVVKLLLEHGANVHAHRLYETPFEIAITRRDFDMAELLIEHGANVAQSIGNNWTLLKRAVSQKDVETIKFLLEHGADVNEKNWFTGTPLMKAASTGHTDIIRLLVEEYGADINAENEHNNGTALSAALVGESLYGGRIEAAKLLIEYGADVNARYNTERSNGITILMEAAKLGEFNFARLLLEHGADVNARSTGFMEAGRTALMYAAGEGSVDVVRLLLEYGADVNKKDKHGETALTIATACGHFDIVELLHK